jgi:hypothetical protein
MTVVLNPPNELLRIDEVCLFVSVDETGEGVCAGPLFGPGTLVPLIAADEARLQSLIPMARRIAQASGKTIRLIKLTTRTELMQIGPDGLPVATQPV